MRSYDLVVASATFDDEEEVNSTRVMRKLERLGRKCYLSEDKITLTSAPAFVRMLITKGHESVLEHVSVTVNVVCDRGVSHELVRHRIAAFSQESTRYCDYMGQPMRFVSPEAYMTPEQFTVWCEHMRATTEAYRRLRELGCTPQIARSVLPNSLKTELAVTFNLRQWRHVFRLRTARAAHPQMRELARPLLAMFKEHLPVIFEDITDEG